MKPPEINGISHFVEHMVFKGTRSRSAQHIAREMDSIGGNLDAFTGKETICFNVKSLADHVPIALDVLADLVLNPVFASRTSSANAASSSKKSRSTKTIPTSWSTSSSPRISGKIIRSASRFSARARRWAELEQKTLFDYHGERFRGGNMVFSAAGNLEHDDLR